MEELEGMEKVYLPNAGYYAKPVSWCSKKVTFKDYFEKFSEKLNLIQPQPRSSFQELLSQLLPGIEMPNNKLKRLMKSMNRKQFFSTPLDPPNGKKRFSTNDMKPSTSTEAFKSISNEDQKTLPTSTEAFKSIQNEDQRTSRIQRKPVKKTIEKTKSDRMRGIKVKNLSARMSKGGSESKPNLEKKKKAVKNKRGKKVNKISAKKIDEGSKSKPNNTKKINMVTDGRSSRNDQNEESETVSNLLDDVLSMQPSTSKGGKGRCPLNTRVKGNKLGKTSTSGKMDIIEKDYVLSMQPSTSKGGVQALYTRVKRNKLGRASTSCKMDIIEKETEDVLSDDEIDNNFSVEVDSDTDLAIATFPSTRPDSSDYTEDTEIVDENISTGTSQSQTLIDGNVDNGISKSSTVGGNDTNVNISIPSENPGLRRSARNKIKVEVQETSDIKTEIKNDSAFNQVSSSNDKVEVDEDEVDDGEVDDDEVEVRYGQRSASDIIHEITRKVSRNNRRSISVRGQIIVDTTQRLGKRDLVPRKNFAVSFRVHKPYRHAIGQRGFRPGKCLQEIDVLDYQTLADLRQKIVCEADYQDTSGNVSKWPYNPVTTLAKDKYKGGMFYIGNTFYIDTQEGAEDYSVVIRKWAKEHNINVGDTKPMDKVKVEDLRVRLGYPYVYMHQGSCEHLIIISQARLLTEKHSLYSSDYPNITKTSRSAIHYCVVCSKDPAKWIVMGSDRMPEDVNFMCQRCYQSYHYIGTEKIGNFKSYRWKQRALLFH